MHLILFSWNGKQKDAETAGKKIKTRSRSLQGVRMIGYCYLGGMDEEREGVALVVGDDDDLVQSHSVQVRPRDKIVEGGNMGTVMPSPVVFQRLAAHVWLQRALCPPPPDEKRMSHHAGQTEEEVEFKGATAKSYFAIAW